MASIEKQLHLCLNKVEKWAVENGFYLFIYLGYYVAFNTVEFVRVLYCKLPTNGKQLPAFPLEAVPGTEPRPQRWEARVLPLCHRGPRKWF